MQPGSLEGIVIDWLVYDNSRLNVDSNVTYAIFVAPFKGQRGLNTIENILGNGDTGIGFE